MYPIGSYFQLATTVFGSGSIAQTGDVAKKLGIKKAMIVTDPGIVNVGHDKKVIAALEAAGVDYILWAEAQPECPAQNVRDGADFARANGIDGIIGIGGGSGLDTAKAISITAPNDNDILNHLVPIYFGEMTIENPQMPLILIPTSFGTGSEATEVAVINDPVTDSKMGMRCPAKYAIVDPSLACGLPAFPTAITGLDALSHATEAVTSVNCTFHTAALAYMAISLIRQYLPAACKDVTALEPREFMATASNFAGIAFCESDVNIGHAVAHAIGHLYHIPHGLGCAWVNPASIELMGKYFPEKVVPLAETFGITVDCWGEKLARKVADANRILMKELGIPTIAEKGITRDQIVSLAEKVYNDALTKQYLHELTLEDCENFVASIYDNYQ